LSSNRHLEASIRQTNCLSPLRKETAPCARTVRRKDDADQAGFLACRSSLLSTFPGIVEWPSGNSRSAHCLQLRAQRQN